MSRFIAAAIGSVAALAFTVCTANASGPTVRDTPSNSWTGLYVGATVGSAEESATWTAGAVITPSADDRGAIFGATIGYNYQMAPWLVVGVEGDWSKLQSTTGPIPACGGPCSTETNWLATIRARAGVLLGPSALIYATGGFAWADVDNSVTIASVSDRATGWAVGAGVEVRLDKHWSLKAEYLRVELDDTLACSPAVCGAANFATDHSLQIVRGGVNFKF